ncbi:MAG: BTAD domain-containing putative transcriptional regulator [Gemmatimonadaceae bacterium]
MSALPFIRLLGTAAVAETWHDTPAHDVPPRRLALLALLALAGSDGIVRARVASLLWPREQSERANPMLDELLSALRSELGDGAVIETGALLRLDTSRVIVDVVEFERAANDGDLERAAELYEGEFLEGFFLEDAVDFEQWASDQRLRLTSRAARVLEQLATDAHDRGEIAAAIALLRRRADLEPYAAEPTLALMHALEASGDAHEALRAGRTYESRIRTFLETDPAPEVLSETRRLRAIVGPAATPATGTPTAGSPGPGLPNGAAGVAPGLRDELRGRGDKR